MRKKVTSLTHTYRRLTALEIMFRRSCPEFNGERDRELAISLLAIRSELSTAVSFSTRQLVGRTLSLSLTFIRSCRKTHRWYLRSKFQARKETSKRLSGRQDSTLCQINPEISSLIDSVIIKRLHLDIFERYQRHLTLYNVRFQRH